MSTVQTLQLAAREVMQLPEKGPIALRVKRGRVWITQANNCHDWFLNAEQSLELSGTRIVIEAEMACELEIAQTRRRWRPWCRLLLMPLVPVRPCT